MFHDDINCQELKSSLFNWFQEYAVSDWLQNNTAYQKLYRAHEKYIQTRQAPLFVWENHLSCYFDRCIDLITGHAINTGLRLFFCSVEHPHDLSPACRALLDIQPVASRPAFARTLKLYNRRKQQLIKERFAVETPGLEEFVEQEEIYQHKTWPHHLAANMVYAYRVAAVMLKQFDSVRENDEFTKKMMETVDSSLLT